MNLQLRFVPAVFAAVVFALISCREEEAASSEPAAPVATEAPAELKPELGIPDERNIPDGSGMATFAGGCFWCVEEVFQQTPGVIAAISGYMGGTPETANYEAVCTGRTDHAEVVQVFWDPSQTSFQALVKRFWDAHDPTQLNRQGPDRGRQYRSAIFYHSEEQRIAAEKAITELAASGKFGSKPIVTEVTEALQFHTAEDNHQNYARLNPANPYLAAQLWPKLKKLDMIIPTGANARLIKGSGPRPKGS